MGIGSSFSAPPGATADAIQARAFSLARPILSDLESGPDRLRTGSYMTSESNPSTSYRACLACPLRITQTTIQSFALILSHAT